MAEGRNSDARFIEEMTFVLFGLFLLSLIVARLLASYSGGDIARIFSWWEEFKNYFLNVIWPVWKWVAGILSVLFVFWIINNLREANKIAEVEKEVYTPSPGALVGVPEGKKNPQWEKVLEHANSSNDSDWRLAILEADVMLEEVLRDKGYVGESIGDMLKSAEGGDGFLTLGQAWDAHKVRNRIAHDGQSFKLNEREKDRVIALFESVFREFDVI